MKRHTITAGFRTRKDETPITEVRINEMINGALTRFGKDDLPKALAGIVTQVSALATATTKVTDQLTALQKAKDDGDGDTGDGNTGDGNTGDGDSNTGDTGDPQLNARMRQLEAQNKKLAGQVSDLTKSGLEKEQQAQRTDQESHVREAIGAFNFVDPSASADAFVIINGMTKRDDAGELIIGSGADVLPMADFVKDFFPSKRPYMLAAEAKGGSGAGNESGNNSAKQIKLEQIIPGASDADLQAAAAQIVKSL